MPPIDFSPEHICAVAESIVNVRRLRLLKSGSGDAQHMEDTYFDLAKLILANTPLEVLTLISLDGLNDAASILLQVLWNKTLARNLKSLWSRPCHVQ